MVLANNRQTTLDVLSVEYTQLVIRGCKQWARSIYNPSEFCKFTIGLHFQAVVLASECRYIAGHAQSLKSWGPVFMVLASL